MKKLKNVISKYGKRCSNELGEISSEDINTYTEMGQKIAHAAFYISLIQVFVLAQIS